jgi:hypothetical protein
MQIWKRLGVFVSSVSITANVVTGVDWDAIDATLSVLLILVDGDPG